VTEDKDNQSKNRDNQTDNDNFVSLQLEVEDEDGESNLKIDENEERNNFDTDSNYSYDHSVDNEQSDRAHLHTPTQNDRVCDFCGAVKKSPSDLARHLLKHTGEHPFKCEVSIILPHSKGQHGKKYCHNFIFWDKQSSK
jgi:hypothetical protein